MEKDIVNVSIVLEKNLPESKKPVAQHLLTNLVQGIVAVMDALEQKEIIITVEDGTTKLSIQRKLKLNVGSKEDIKNKEKKDVEDNKGEQDSAV